MYDLRYLFLHWEGGVDPMDLKAPALHATEPSHLPLGKLVDGNLKSGEHLVVRDLPRQVFGHELIFQTVVDEVCLRQAEPSPPRPSLLPNELSVVG